MTLYNNSDDSSFVVGAHIDEGQIADPIRNRQPGASPPSGDRNGVTETLARLAYLAAQGFPAAAGASVTAINGSASTMTATTKASIAEMDRLQDETGQGPRIEAARFSDTVLSGALDNDPRWPLLAPAMVGSDIRSALAQPIVTEDGPVGILTIYSEKQHAFDAQAVQWAAIFAGPAAVAMANAQRTDRESRASMPGDSVIERALGIMMSRSTCSEDRAMLRLQKMSQYEHVDLVAMAQAVIDEALVETCARYLSVRDPHRPYGNKAPATEAPSTPLAEWGDWGNRGADGLA